MILRPLYGLKFDVDKTNCELKMKKLFYILLFFLLVCFSQNEQLAQYYYDKGDFEKAKISYEELLKEILKLTVFSKNN
jgi:hypothetical protein